MRSLHKDVWLGIGTILFGVMLLVYAIPGFISAPSNVRKLVLSPILWPTIVAWIVILLGALLIASRVFFTPSEAEQPDPQAIMFETREDKIYAWMRLAASAVLMFGIVATTPYIGMILASILAFALFSIVIMAPRPLISLAVAIAIPVILYFFFEHVAGVSIPQGRLLLLP